MAITVTDTRTTLTNASTLTGWTGAASVSTTVYAEGGSSVVQTLNIATGQVYFTTSPGLNLSNQLIYVWSNNFALQALWDATNPPNGLHLGDGTNRISFRMAGANRKVFAHLDSGYGVQIDWDCLVLDGSQASAMDAAGLTIARAGSFASLNLNSITQIGSDFDTKSKGLGGGINVAVDCIRYGNAGIRMTGGLTGDRGNFLEIVLEDRSMSAGRALGIIREYTTGLYGCQGPLIFGDSFSAGLWFEDSNVALVFENRNISNDKYFIQVVGNMSGSTTNFILRSSSISTAGPHVRLDFNAFVDTLILESCSFRGLGGTISFYNDTDAQGHQVKDNVFSGCGTINTGVVIFTGNVVSGCGTVTAQGGDLRNTSILLSTAAADASALVWNVATNPDGVFDGMTFSKGTNAHHAIEFGTSSPTSMTLRNVTATGFNASNAQNDSTFYIARTSGTVTISCVGCVGNMTYKSAGATVVIVQDPVTVKVTVTDVLGNAIDGARVLVKASSGTGPFPYQASVTISNSGTTATVTHTGHGLSSNDKVLIEGASLLVNNGIHEITKISDNSYSYVLSSAPGSSPTGTITATFVALYGVTSGGVVSTSRVYSSDQPVTGWARKASNPPYYKPGPIVGPVDSTDGLNATAVMIVDE
jgi:hypothetical protein